MTRSVLDCAALSSVRDDLVRMLTVHTNGERHKERSQCCSLRQQHVGEQTKVSRGYAAAERELEGKGQEYFGPTSLTSYTMSFMRTQGSVYLMNCGVATRSSYIWRSIARYACRPMLTRIPVGPFRRPRHGVEGWHTQGCPYVGPTGT